MAIAAGLSQYTDTTAPATPLAASGEVIFYPRTTAGVVGYYFKAEDGVEHALQGVPDTRLVIAGAGLTGGGDLSADRTIDVANVDGTIAITANEIHRAAITGDVGIPAGSNTATLAVIGAATGPIGSSLSVPVVTIDTKGRVTALTSAALGTAAAKNVGNTVLDPGTGKLEYAYPSLGLITGTNRTYLSTERGYIARRSNGGAAMSDTLPLLANTVADIGYTITVYNEDTVLAAVLTMNASGGALFRSATGGTSATSPLNYGTRQQFVWDGVNWILTAGNANIVRRSGVIVGGNIPKFLDAAGNIVVDSGLTLAGNNTGDLTLTAAGSVANANAATLTGQALTLQPASTTFAGNQSALDKLKEDNIWIDVTANTVARILTTNTGAQNVTAWNTLYAAAPVGAIFYFPPGTYDFDNELACARDIRMRIQGAGIGRTTLRTTSLTANLFNQSVAGFYIDFKDFSVDCNATNKSAGAGILASSNNAYLSIFNVEFQHMFRSIHLSSGAGNVGYFQQISISAPSTVTAGSPSQLKIDGAGINTMFHMVNLNVTGVSTIGIEINQCGAVQWTNCDIIGGLNAMLINATNVVSALFFTNVFFDQSTFGSTVKIIGTAGLSRCKFIQCGITTGGGAGLNALEIAGTGAGTGIPEALDFEQCDFYNNGFAGTTNGLLVTGCRGIDIKDCRISGFTNGVNFTPYSANGVTNFNIEGCTVGPTENFAGNGTGILINAGAVQYGPSVILGNDLQGNTTAPLTDNGTYTNNLLIVQQNLGLATAPKVETPNLLLPAATTTRAGAGWAHPVNSLRVGARLRVTAIITSAAAALATETPTFKIGTLNTSADTDLITTSALAAGTAALGSMLCQYDIHIDSTTTATVMAQFINAGATGVSSTNYTARGSAGEITIPNITTSALFMAPYFNPTTANHTLRSVAYEVIQQ